MNLKKIVSENLKNYRKKKNLSQENLAEQCGLHRTYISSIERAERNISLSTLDALAKGLEINVVELLKQEVKEND